MEFENNILAKYLENVLFVSGLACGGKTTMAKALAAEFGLTYINETENYAKYKEIATLAEQPNLAYQREDWHTFFNRPAAEYDAWVFGSMEETGKMLLLDLIQASQHKQVITDAYFPVNWLQEITIPDRVFILVAPTSVVVEEYFQREDKRDMLAAITQLPNGEETLAHFMENLAFSNDKRLKEQIDSGFSYLIREEGASFSRRYDIVAQHFSKTLKES